jgi:hypothetical protein
MEYFAGLDVSTAETHVCVMNRDGAVSYEVRVPSNPTTMCLLRCSIAGTVCERPVMRTPRSHLTR